MTRDEVVCKSVYQHPWTGNVAVDTVPIASVCCVQKLAEDADAVCQAYAIIGLVVCDLR